MASRMWCKLVRAEEVNGEGANEAVEDAGLQFGKSECERRKAGCELSEGGLW